MPLACQFNLNTRSSSARRKERFGSRQAHSTDLRQQLASTLCWAVLSALGGVVHAAPEPPAVQQGATAITNRPLVPSFDVRRYTVAGSDALSQESISRVMGEATGPTVSLQQIRRALVK